MPSLVKAPTGALRKIVGRVRPLAYCRKDSRPLCFSSSNRRDFGGNFEESKIRSWFTIESTEIGKVKDLEVQNEAGLSKRRRRLSETGRLKRSSWVYEELRTTVKSSHAVKSGTLGEGSTQVTVVAAGNYPFYSILSPDIDYKFVIYFWVTSRNEITTKIGYNHNSFPDYEVRIDDKVVYQFATKDAGPGYWNLAVGPNEQGVKDGPVIHAETGSGR